MAGHVFVIRGDLRKLACDAWLLPCDLRAQPERDWLDGMPTRFDLGRNRPPDGWQGGAVRAFQATGVPDELPTPWLVNVGAYEGKEVGWYVAGAREFIERASRALKAHAAQPRYGREKFLLALPLVGTGRGGAARSAGEVVRDLLPALNDAVRAWDVDVVLTTASGAAFAAGQVERVGEGRSAWGELDSRLLKKAHALADLAAQKRLVLFIGAGVGKAAGLPGWSELIERLGSSAGLAGMTGELAALDPLDAAALIARRLEPKLLGEAVAEVLSERTHYGLGHALIAGLPVEEFVTTNYDRLFEEAAAAAGQPVRILPYEAELDRPRWLLKMHGCISHPEDIVLAREGYLRYEERWGALAGIVQALLITRHMLFVGFGLRDDNFHRIADSVRRAVRRSQPGRRSNRPFGTALVVGGSPFEHELWEGDLEWVRVEPGVESGTTGSGGPSAAGARQLEILLDCVLARTSASAHFLDRDYEGLLSAEERALAGDLEQLVRRHATTLRGNATWTRIAGLLRSIGLRGSGRKAPTD